MAGKVRKEGVVLRTEDYETSHSVFITRQEENCAGSDNGSG